jgi:hypothetical protein
MLTNVSEERTDSLPEMLGNRYQTTRCQVLTDHIRSVKYHSVENLSNFGFAKLGGSDMSASILKSRILFLNWPHSPAGWTGFDCR